MQVKKQISFLIKLIISCIFLFYILQFSNLQEIFNKFVRIKIEIFLLAFIADILGLLFTTLTWKILFSTQKFRIKKEPSYLKLLSYNLVGKFFNFLLPTNIGGDIVKAYDLSKYSKSKSSAVASIFMVRFIGIFSMLTFITIGTFVNHNLLSKDLLYILLLITSIALIFSFLLFSKRIYLSPFFMKHLEFFGIDKKIKKFHTAIHLYRKDKFTVIKAYSTSITFHIFLILRDYLVALALGFHIPITYLVLIVPLVKVILLLPISLSGIGIREGSFVYFLTKIGISYSDALSLPLLSYIFLLFQALIGFFIYFLESYK
ncbi:hypothetical protein DRN73_07760 [Candidatus Pacearchaeota archaeon]|nr:MAG: hypothetical protein DRN73_07760 [Candidatus Pacearchaeota archaeon]